MLRLTHLNKSPSLSLPRRNHIVHAYKAATYLKKPEYMLITPHKDLQVYEADDILEMKLYPGTKVYKLVPIEHVEIHCKQEQLDVSMKKCSSPPGY